MADFAVIVLEQMRSPVSVACAFNALFFGMIGAWLMRRRIRSSTKRWLAVMPRHLRQTDLPTGVEMPKLDEGARNEQQKTINRHARAAVVNRELAEAAGHTPKGAAYARRAQLERNKATAAQKAFG